MRDERDFVDEDPLDRLLGSAQWPEPDVLRLARLEREWNRTLSCQRQRRRRVRVALAAAAVFAATALGLWWISAGAPREQFIAPGGPGRQDTPPLVEEEPQQALAIEDSFNNGDMQGDLLPGRAPTVYELLVLRSKENQRKTPRGDPLERAVQQLMAKPDVEIEQLAESLIARRAVHERRLLQSIPNVGRERQIAEARILGAIGSARSVPLLVQLSRREPTRSVAMAGLKRLADSAALAKLASAGPDEQMRRGFLAALLDRGDPLSLGFFADAVLDPRTAAPALAVFDGSTEPPLDSIAALLTGPSAERRATAAWLLGRSKHPDAIARLIDLAKNDSTRQPALMALLASDDPKARRFLVEAWSHPQTRGAVQLAQFEWQVAAWQVSLPKLPEVY